MKTTNGLHLAAGSSGDVTVGDCADVDCAANSESVGDLITEPSLSDPSSIKDCTFENTPNRAKWSRKTVFVFNIISSRMLSTTKWPSSSSYKGLVVSFEKESRTTFDEHVWAWDAFFVGNLNYIDRTEMRTLNDKNNQHMGIKFIQRNTKANAQTKSIRKQM